MRRPLALSACFSLVLLMTGCPTFEGTPQSYDAGGVNCHANSAPAIGNVEINSLPSEEAETYLVSLHFDWVDPGVSGAEDPSNLLGGHISIEFFGGSTEDIRLDRRILEEACTWESEVEDDPSPCLPFGHSLAGCADAKDNCPQGEITGLFVPLDFTWVQDEEIELEFRIRDACGAMSNEKAATYEIGSGMAVEDGADGDDDEGA